MTTGAAFPFWVEETDLGSVTLRSSGPDAESQVENKRRTASSRFFMMCSARKSLELGSRDASQLSGDDDTEVPNAPLGDIPSPASNGIITVRSDFRLG